MIRPAGSRGSYERHPCPTPWNPCTTCEVSGRNRLGRSQLVVPPVSSVTVPRGLKLHLLAELHEDRQMVGACDVDGMNIDVLSLGGYTVVY